MYNINFITVKLSIIFPISMVYKQTGIKTIHDAKLVKNCNSRGLMNAN